MYRILAFIFAMAMACAVSAQDIATRFPDNYQGDDQYRVARAIDPVMGSLGTYTASQLLRHDRLDAVDAIGDRGCFAMRSGVVVTPRRDADGALNLGVKPASLAYEYSAPSELDCLEMIAFLAERYSPSEEPINPCDVVAGEVAELPVTNGTLRIEGTPGKCVFTLLPSE